MYKWCWEDSARFTAPPYHPRYWILVTSFKNPLQQNLISKTSTVSTKLTFLFSMISLARDSKPWKPCILRNRPTISTYSNKMSSASRQHHGFDSSWLVVLFPCHAVQPFKKNGLDFFKRFTAMAWDCPLLFQKYVQLLTLRNVQPPSHPFGAMEAHRVLLRRTNWTLCGARVRCPSYSECDALGYWHPEKWNKMMILCRITKHIKNTSCLFGCVF